MLSILLVISSEEKSLLNKYILDIATGDSNALESIYKMVGGRLLSVAIGILRNRELAEDVVQDSFVKIVRYSINYRKDTNAYAWLCTIVRNSALNKLKSEKLRQGIDIDSCIGLTDNEDLYANTLVSIEVKQALAELDSRERVAIWLRYYNEMPVRQIAEELGMKKSTANDMIKRAEDKLKVLLGG